MPLAVRRRCKGKLRQCACFQIDHAEKKLEPLEEVVEILEALCEDTVPFAHEIACHVVMARTLIRTEVADRHIEGFPTVSCMILSTFVVVHTSRVMNRAGLISGP